MSLAGLTPDWFAIASTPSVTARNNTSTQGTGGVPIYLITGERVADDYGDLWNGSIQTAINTTPSDTLQDTRVWTGTTTNGGRTPSSLGANVGSFVEVASYGGSGESVGRWITQGIDPIGNGNRLYGMSSVLEVPGAQSTPEPSSLLGFITLGGLMLGSGIKN